MPYCSIECCQKHKQQSCQPVTVLEVVTSEPALKSKYLPSDMLLRDPNLNALHRRTTLDLDDDEDDKEIGWKITRDMMDSINQSQWVKQELQDGGLRQIIYEIESAPNTVLQSGKTEQEETLERLKSKYPNFRGFLDKLLVTAGVLEREKESEDMMSWLYRSEDDLGPLALKPIPRRGQAVIQPLVMNDDTSSDEGTSSDYDSSSTEESSESD